MLGQILVGIGGLIMLIRHIIVIVKMFQHGQTALGIITAILTCCGVGFLVSLIYGWIKSTEWNIKNVMLVYSLGVAAHIVGEVMTPVDVSAIRKQLGQ
jgi:hypothetical protein